MSSLLPPRYDNKTENQKNISHDFSEIPVESLKALRNAMVLEHVPDDQFTDLVWIMEKESSGVVDNRNSISSARGLYQLTKANYHLNPNCENSFGNAVEECQGGIRYVTQRYKTATAAREFWEKHNWY